MLTFGIHLLKIHIGQLTRSPYVNTEKNVNKITESSSHEDIYVYKKIPVGPQ